MNRILTILLACCLVCIGNAQTKPKIAIFDPTVVSMSLGSGTKDAIRELISSTVVNSKRYTVLERAMLEKILQEQAFSNSSMVNDKDAVAIGKLAGAEKVLVSVLSSASEKFLFTVKLLNLETSDVEYQQFCYASSIEDLLKKIEPTLSKLFDCEIKLYEGERKDGRPHGYGIMEYRYKGYGGKDAKWVYRGDWFNGLRQGKGIMESDGEIYDGDWFNDKEHGNGFKRYRNGNEYNGEWKYGTKSGKGVLVYQDGERFEGEFLNGKPSYGTLKYTNGNQFEGKFKDGSPLLGVLKFPNGDIYQGDFSNCYGGQPGSSKGNVGVMTYANGNKFEGRFFYGPFVRGGAYNFYYQSGIMYYINGDRYEGRILKGKRCSYQDEGHSAATMYYSNGDIYKGSWEDAKREGHGVMKWRDGSVYDGNWEDDMMHGYGKMISSKGRVKKGYWSYGIKQHKRKR